MPSARFALGTVQFGLRYGIANRDGQPPLQEARQIVREARSAGIDTLDTAIAYGDSEQRLGEIGVQGMRVVTKLPAFPAGMSDVALWTRENVNASLRRLKTDRLYGLLLHKSADLLESQGQSLYRAMRQLQAEGMVEKIGVSIYAPEDLQPLASRYAFDLVQCPFNALDRRLQTSGALRRLRAQGTEVHVRSVFLQGLLLMSPQERPAKFGRWQSLWVAWHRWLDEAGLSPLRGCIGAVLAQPEIDRVVIGVDRVAQLREILAAAEAEVVPPPLALAADDADLLNPSRWSAL